MTIREAAIVSTYTGTLMCSFDDVHEYIEHIMGRPVWTHEMANAEVWEEIKERAKPDFLAICESLGKKRRFSDR